MYIYINTYIVLVNIFPYYAVVSELINSKSSVCKTSINIVIGL
jgi:hypothetical protein